MLSKINKHFYRIEGNSTLKRYIFTSQETRDICNKPEILGCDYTDRMEKGMVKALSNFPIDLSSIPEEQACIVNFLRGGLNFRLREAMNKALSFNRHPTSFMSSQRYIRDGRWGVEEDQYRKFIFPKNPSLFIGDVVATGVTAQAGLRVVLDAMKEKGVTPKNLFFMTIGCHKIEKILEELMLERKDMLGAAENVAVIYIEGKFRLADSKTKLRIRIPGTDLLRTDALLSPEFEMSQYQSTSHLLERCTIYDAGSRAFDIAEYLEDVRDYWMQTETLAKSGMSYKEAVMERWPEHTTYQSFAKSRGWNDKKSLEEAYSAYNTMKLALDSISLREICKTRLSDLA